MKLRRYTVSDFVRHFEMLTYKPEIKEILEHNKNNPFWVTARQYFNENDYNLLKEEIIGKERKNRIRRKRRNL